MKKVLKTKKEKGQTNGATVSCLGTLAIVLVLAGFLYVMYLFAVGKVSLNNTDNAEATYVQEVSDVCGCNK